MQGGAAAGNGSTTLCTQCSVQQPCSKHSSSAVTHSKPSSQPQQAQSAHQFHYGQQQQHYAQQPIPPRPASQRRDILGDSPVMNGRSASSSLDQPGGLGHSHVSLQQQRRLLQRQLSQQLPEGSGPGTMTTTEAPLTIHHHHHHHHHHHQQSRQPQRQHSQQLPETDTLPGQHHHYHHHHREGDAQHQLQGAPNAKHASDPSAQRGIQAGAGEQQQQQGQQEPGPGPNPANGHSHPSAHQQQQQPQLLGRQQHANKHPESGTSAAAAPVLPITTPRPRALDLSHLLGGSETSENSHDDEGDEASSALSALPSLTRALGGMGRRVSEGSPSAHGGIRPSSSQRLGTDPDVMSPSRLLSSDSSTCGSEVADVLERRRLGRNNYHLTGQAAVELFMRLNHARQTLDFAKRQATLFSTMDRARLDVWQALDRLNELREYEAALMSGSAEVDPDMPLREHALQTAELCRMAHPSLDWLHLVGLMHGLGKLLAHQTFGSQPQWATCGESFPLGCRFDPCLPGTQFFSVNPDRRRRLYNTPLGIYQQGCGLHNVYMSWSACEYLYLMLLLNDTELPPEALFIIRHQKFLALTKPGGSAYHQLLSPEDKALLPLLASFQQLSSYKRVTLPMPATAEEEGALRAYYDGLIAKYIGDRPLCW